MNLLKIMKNPGAEFATTILIIEENGILITERIWMVVHILKLLKFRIV